MRRSSRAAALAKMIRQVVGLGGFDQKERVGQRLQRGCLRRFAWLACELPGGI
jgi:hypothetical protein